MNKNKNHNKIVDRLSTKLTTHKKIMAAYPNLLISQSPEENKLSHNVQ
jgi:hypothetical protein